MACAFCAGGSCWTHGVFTDKGGPSIPVQKPMFDKPQERLRCWRFGVGTQVLCNTGPGEWSAGEIVKLAYREPDWPQGCFVPYQVLLDDGDLIYVPGDNDNFCRLLVPPWWANYFSGATESDFMENPPGIVIRNLCATKNVNEQNHRGETAILQTARLNWRVGLLELIDMMADVNIASNDKTHPLHAALKHGPELMKILIDAKADVNCQDTDPDYNPDFTSTTFGNRTQNKTPLHYVCLSGDVAAAELLLTASAITDVQDAQYKTALHGAIGEDNNDIIDVLLRHKADVNLANIESGMKNTPLMDAAHGGKLQLVEKLILAKADLNRQGKQQMSALHLAARKGYAKIAQVLIEASADVNQESQAGTAVQLARKKGGHELLQVFGIGSGTRVDPSPASLDAAQRAALFLE